MANTASDNPGNFARNRKKARRAGSEGAKQQPTEAKREGGRRSSTSS